MSSKKESPEIAQPAGTTAEAGAGAKTGRRSFLSRVGLWATVAGIAGQSLAFLRSLLPNVLYEAPLRVKIGPPDNFGEGAQFLEDRRLYVFRERNTFHVMSAVCTHLGCTVKMERLNQPKKVSAGGRELTESYEFRCPCHGSKYHGDGTNYAGPAPRPLDFFKVELSPEDGQLVVDTSQSTNRDFRLTV